MEQYMIRSPKNYLSFSIVLGSDILSNNPSLIYEDEQVYSRSNLSTVESLVWLASFFVVYLSVDGVCCEGDTCPLFWFYQRCRKSRLTQRNAGSERGGYGFKSHSLLQLSSSCWKKNQTIAWYCRHAVIGLYCLANVSSMSVVADCESVYLTLAFILVLLISLLLEFIN